jgi:CheY-like chemotaxis protein
MAKERMVTGVGPQRVSTPTDHLSGMFPDFAPNFALTFQWNRLPAPVRVVLSRRIFSDFGTASMTNDTIDVLLVENSDADSRITSAAVRTAAPLASLVRVKDGDQALRLIFSKGLFTKEPQIPRLILLELHAPRTNGSAVLERLRDDANARAVPVVLLTSSPIEGHVEASHASGAYACLVKSFHPDEYFSEVSRFVKHYLKWTH